MCGWCPCDDDELCKECKTKNREETLKKFNEMGLSNDTA